MFRSVLAAGLTSLLAAPAAAQDLTLVEQLGKSIFFDTSLSLNGTTSCFFCHDPDMGFTSLLAEVNAAGAVVPGAVEGRFGNRKPPSAAYASFPPSLHHTLDDGNVPFVGGAFLDGRATGHLLGSAIADQALQLFLNPLEMALPDSVCVVARILNPANPSDYPVRFAEVWGDEAADVAISADLLAQCQNVKAGIGVAGEDLRSRIDATYHKIAFSLAASERTPEVKRFSYRFDAWQHGADTLSAEEIAGEKLFEAEDKGNYAACHVMTPNTQGGPTVFSDWTFDNLGVPRNRENPFCAEPSANPKARLTPVPEWADSQGRPGLCRLCRRQHGQAAGADPA